MKTLQECKDELANRDCYRYIDFEHMELMLGDRCNDFIAERLLDATLNYAKQFVEPERLLIIVNNNLTVPPPPPPPLQQ
jgi:hypothetical protein